MKLRDGEDVIGVEILSAKSKTPILAVVSQRGRVLLCKAQEIGALSGPGRGVTVMKVDAGDRLFTARLLPKKDDHLIVFKPDGSKLPISTKKYQPVTRGGKGHAMIKRGVLSGFEPSEIVLPDITQEP